MRSCFKNIDRKNREKIYEFLINSKSPHKRCINNLLGDLATNDKTMCEIRDYLLTHFECFTGSYEQRSKIDSQKLQWERQADLVKIKNPDFLFSVQDVKAVVGTINTQSAYIPELGKIDMGGDILEQILDEAEKIRVNNSKYPLDKISPVKIRENVEDNIWITWNEDNPKQFTALINHKHSRDYIVKLLGLGFYLEQPDRKLIGLMFDVTSQEMELYRPGWGDARTFHYWQPITNSNAAYGYTKSLDETGKDQPEAVSAIKNFNLSLINHQSIAL